MKWFQQLLAPIQSMRESTVAPQASAVKPRKTLSKVWLLALIAVISAGAAAYYFWAPKNAKADWQRDTIRVTRGKAEMKVVATGVVKPIREVKISPKQTGLLKNLYVRQGDLVKQGQVIAEMDDSNLLGQIEAARGAYLAAVDNYEKLKSGNRPQEIAASRYQQQRAQQAIRHADQNISRLRAQKEALKAQLKRNEQFANAQAFLAKSGAISEQAKIDAITAADVTRAQLEAADRELTQAEVSKAQSESEFSSLKQQYDLIKAGFRKEEISAAFHSAQQANGSLKHLESLLNDTRIKAPFDGIVTQKYADAGAIVTPTTSAATTSATSSSIVALAGTLELVAQVSEANVTRISRGQQVEITATSYPAKVFQGVVTFIAPAAIVTSNVTTFEVHVRLVGDAERELLSGMNVSAKFIVGETEDALLVPSVCIVSRRGETGVFIPDEKGEPTFKAIHTGAVVDKETVVLAGLKEGDRVFKGLSRDQLGQEGYMGRDAGRGRGPSGAMGGRRGPVPRGFGR